MTTWRGALLISAMVVMQWSCGMLGNTGGTATPGTSSGNGSGGSASGGSGGGGGGGSGATTIVQNAKFFPQGLALTSPLQARRGPAQGTAPTQTAPSFFQRLLPSVFIQEAHAAPGTYASAFAESTQLISGVLAGTIPAASVLSPQDFTRNPMLVECYGPMLKYTGHPDYSPSSGGGGPGPGPGSGIPAGGPSSGPDGQLPPGDLGIWLDTEKGSGPMAGNACSAAKLNAQLEGNSAKVNAALVALASMARAVAASDAGAVSPGSSIDLKAAMNALGIATISFSKATFSIDSSGNTWTYELNFDLTAPPPSGGGSSSTRNVVVKLSHTAGTDLNSYSGLLAIFSDDPQPMGCPPGSAATMATTLSYERSGEKKMDFSARSSGYCNVSPGSFSSSLLTSSGELDPTQNISPPTRTTGWSKSFDRFGASFDPTSSTLAGSYAYAWQAGSMDSHSRVFNIRLNSSTASGEAYFGYGDAIGVSDGSIKGFICNWAGPGNSHALSPLCQRQFIEFDATAGAWKQPPGGSDIRYAPTNSCEYTHAQVSAGATFWYDRDLTYASSGSSSAPELIVDKTDATYPLDMMEKGTSATISEAIVARGFVLPTNF